MGGEMSDTNNLFQGFNPEVLKQGDTKIAEQNVRMIGSVIAGVEAANEAFQEASLYPVFHVMRNSRSDYTVDENTVYIRVADRKEDRSEGWERNAVGVALECNCNTVAVAGLRTTFMDNVATYTTRQHHEDIQIFGHRVGGHPNLWGKTFNRTEPDLEQKAITQAVEHLRFWLHKDYPEHAAIFDDMLGVKPNVPEQDHDNDCDVLSP